MPDPHLLVDQGDQGEDFAAPPVRHLEVEGASDMQGFHLGQPGESDVVAGPAALDRDRDFILVLAVERPCVDAGQALDHIYGMFGAFMFKFGCGHFRALGAAMLWNAVAKQSA